MQRHRIKPEHEQAALSSAPIAYHAVSINGCFYWRRLANNTIESRQSIHLQVSLRTHLRLQPNFNICLCYQLITDVVYNDHQETLHRRE